MDGRALVHNNVGSTLPLRLARELRSLIWAVEGKSAGRLEWPELA